MDLAYAAADLVLARSGAMTVAEIGAVGLPAVYVPLPHGNGEQRLNADGQVAAGAAIVIDDAELTPTCATGDPLERVVPLLSGTLVEGAAMAAAAATGPGPPTPGAELAAPILRLAAERARPMTSFGPVGDAQPPITADGSSLARTHLVGRRGSRDERDRPHPRRPWAGRCPGRTPRARTC